MFPWRKSKFQEVCDTLNRIDTDCDRIANLSKFYTKYVRADGLDSLKLKMTYANTLTGNKRAYALKWIEEQ